jgi:2-oxoglutarate dehydrogenase E2 component (dihydrolipoamide succinyltransferase)
MKEDDVVCQIETDKVTADVRAPESGILNEVFAKEGETVYINKPLFSYTPGAEEAPKETKKAETPAEEEPKKEAPEREEKAAQPKREEKAPQKPITPPSMRDINVERSETRTPMSRMRQRVAQRLKEAQNTLAMLTTFNEVDMTNLMKMRKKYGEEFLQRHGVKLGMMSTFVKACAYALQEQPAINAGSLFIFITHIIE